MASPVFLLILSSFVVSVLCGTLSYSSDQNVHEKIIKTKDGVYDCVNFYKQPAFNHPLLKNHTSKATENLAEFQAQKASKHGLIYDACPIGTVPILRAFRDTFSNGDMPHSIFQKPQAHCVAIVHTNNLSWKLFGVAGGLTIFKPAVANTQWSSARIKLLNGAESIEAGWMVNPSLFNDTEAHLYAKRKADREECINLECSGFIQVSRNVYLGAIPRSYSKIGARTQQYWNISIDKDQERGDWWLSFSSDKTRVGYWPKELFAKLAKHANQVEWGGEIDNPGAKRPIPEMGNGYFASYDISSSAGVIHATLVDDKYKTVTPGEDTHKVWDCEDLYTVKDADYIGENFGRLILYGGPKL